MPAKIATKRPATTPNAATKAGTGLQRPVTAPVAAPEDPAAAPTDGSPRQKKPQQTTEQPPDDPEATCGVDRFCCGCALYTGCIVIFFMFLATDVLAIVLLLCLILLPELSVKKTYIDEKPPTTTAETFQPYDDRGMDVFFIPVELVYAVVCYHALLLVADALLMLALCRRIRVLFLVSTVVTLLRMLPPMACIGVAAFGPMNKPSVTLIITCAFLIIVTAYFAVVLYAIYKDAVSRMPYWWTRWWESAEQERVRLVILGEGDA